MAGLPGPGRDTELLALALGGGVASCFRVRGLRGSWSLSPGCLTRVHTLTVTERSSHSAALTARLPLYPVASGTVPPTRAL